ncbi:hypothetical protein BTA51_05880 [Hahella sp. CCB-MM4]|uniref:DUF2000 domain-containing protein n=1 Tax=Hahella sp. (strain CCB-MM4) TaxID=1926491 RepID=UPI000BC6DB5B|nr:DUF2000 domain-containing protein [Hahella sp. CCB-MM4]OZG74528.1 hypothetical protein BTA51_05880 [Hahella sp. CCB-MM4]
MPEITSHTSDNKWAIVVDQSLPVGLMANATAVLSLTLGKLKPELIGTDMTDGAGLPHIGITKMAMPVLKGTGELLNQLRAAIREHEPELLVVDLTSDTLNTRSNQEYQERLSETLPEEIEYLGIALYGSKKLVNRYTGNLGLLR